MSRYGLGYTVTPSHRHIVTYTCTLGYTVTYTCTLDYTVTYTCTHVYVTVWPGLYRRIYMYTCSKGFMFGSCAMAINDNPIVD